MSTVGNIYTESYSRSSAARSADEELTEIIEKEIIDGIGDSADITRETVTDLVFAGSSTAQKQGFESGFKYAVSLLLESLLG